MKIFFAIFLALLLSVGLSYATASALTNLFNLPSWWALIFTPWLLVLLKGIENFFRSVRDNRMLIAEAIATRERTKHLEMSGLLCYKCRMENTAIIHPNKTSTFECVHCKALNKVIVAHKCIHPATDYETFNMDKDILEGAIDG